MCPAAAVPAAGAGSGPDDVDVDDEASAVASRAAGVARGSRTELGCTFQAWAGGDSQRLRPVRERNSLNIRCIIS